MVGGYWSRGDTDFGYSIIVPSALEDVDQPGSRSDDHFCCYLCGQFSAVPHGSPLAGILLDASPSECVRLTLGKFQFASFMGCVCHLDVLYRFTGVLVYGPDPRLCRDPRPGGAIR